MVLFKHVSYCKSISYCHTQTTLLGADGFEFTSVLPGSHFVTVRGTSGGQSLDATLGPLTSVPELTVSLTVSVSGTVVTATIEANQAATFECQLDNDAFVPCKQGNMTCLDFRHFSSHNQMWLLL